MPILANGVTKNASTAANRKSPAKASEMPAPAAGLVYAGYDAPPFRDRKVGSESMVAGPGNRHRYFKPE
jgi:hypothetical protein